MNLNFKADNTHMKSGSVEDIDNIVFRFSIGKIGLNPPLHYSTDIQLRSGMPSCKWFRGRHSAENFQEEYDNIKKHSSYTW